MLTQYLYALGSMLPCPIWLWYRWPSATFLLSLFGWSVYNGATYYIDVFGTRFQKELEQMKKDVAKWQTASSSPLMTPKAGDAAASPAQDSEAKDAGKKQTASENPLDNIPDLE